MKLVILFIKNIYLYTTTMAKLIGEEYVQGDRASICTNKNGKKFFLATKKVTLKNGKQSQIYFWAAMDHFLKYGESACTVPAGFTLAETVNGMPVLRKG